MKYILLVFITLNLYAYNFNVNVGKSFIIVNKCNQLPLTDNAFILYKKCFDSKEFDISELLCDIEGDKIICLDNLYRHNFILAFDFKIIDSKINIFDTYIEAVEIKYEDK